MPFSHRLLESRAGHISIWDPPLVGRRYAIGADVSEGKVRDRVIVRRRIDTMRDRPDMSAACVVEVESGEHVATWHGWDNPLAYAQALYALGMEYNQALLVVELNGPGVAVVEHLVRVLGYPNMYISKLLARSDMHQNSDVVEYGWRTTQSSKADLIMRIQEALSTKTLRTRDRRLVKELRTMQYDDMGNPRAKGSDRDDLVMGYGLALRGRFELMVGTERTTQDKPIDGPDSWIWRRKDEIVGSWQGRPRPPLDTLRRRYQ